MRIHKLKLRQEFCDDILSGKKSFEIRNNDRGFQTGDHIQFIPVDSLSIEIEHPIAQIEYKIMYILSGWGLKNGYVAIGIKDVKFDDWTSVHSQKFFGNSTITSCNKGVIKVLNINSFISKSKEIVAEYSNSICEDKITKDNVYTVWSCKTLQNCKALMVTAIEDGMYYELTYNGNRNEIYMDAYKKQKNKLYKVEDDE